MKKLRILFAASAALTVLSALAFFNNLVAIVNWWRAFVRAGGDTSGVPAHAPGCFAWLEAHPLTDWNWDGQFEDIKPEKPYRNPTKHNAVDVMFYILTASLEDDIFQMEEEYDIPSDVFCQTDPITLKTVVRANPGIVELHQGTVTAKWNARDFK